jgi:hypothetical protein
MQGLKVQKIGPLQLNKRQVELVFSNLLESQLTRKKGRKVY